ncbi:hypothetical protein LTR08_003873 [Meristemomyces frigidus]|nr:hypothetical protein LTR08_003873 [Meristemomyces frigidus]
MVSTRRMAQKEPEQDMADTKLSNTLRKKPVRRATAKKTEPEPQPEPRRIRGRKAAPTPDPVVAEHTVTEAPVPEPQAKSARKVGRPRKKAPEPTAPEPTPAEEPIKATRSTKASTAKNAEMMAAKAATSAPEPVKRTRATAPKAQPLSPKKITQVSRPQARNVKSVNAKPAIAKVAPKPRTTRKRTISDENADVPELSPTEQEDDDVVLLSSTPVRRASPPKHPAANKDGVESEGTMSSGPTTPSDSPAPTFDHMADEHEYHTRDGAVSPNVVEEEDEDEEPMNESEDELCGPKTPLKRQRLASDARFHASVQKSIRLAQLNTPMEKSHTLATRSRRLGTPQTQKPYNKPAVPASEVRPMTVARGADRAFVFRDIRVAPTEEEEEHESENSMLPVEQTLAHDEDTEGSTSPALDGNHDGVLGRTPTATTDHGEATSEEPIEISDDESVQQDDVSDHETEMDDDVSPNLEEDEEDSVLATRQQHEAPGGDFDPEETILVEDDDQDAVAPPAEENHGHLDSEDTILITRNEDDSLLEAHDDHVESETDSTEAASGTPETMIWENIRQDVTIPIDFDAHMTGIRVNLQAEATERLSIVADFAPFPMAGSDEEDAVAEVEQDESPEEQATGIVQDEAQSSVLITDEDNFDPTVDLDIFIDMAALAEPTQRIELPPLEMSQHVQPASKETMVTEEMVAASVSATDERTSTNVKAIVEQDDNDTDISPPPESNGEVSKEESDEADVPHYALPTLAFDARRKSMPAFGMHTPAKNGNRPNTSDGGSIARLLNPFGESWWARTRAETAVEPPVRPYTAHGASSSMKVGTPGRAGPEFDEATTPCAPPQERFPRLQSRNDYQEYAQTAVPASRFHTPIKSSVKRPATAQKSAAMAVTPRASTLRPRRQASELESIKKSANTPTVAANAVAEMPSERYPRREPRPNYQEHAKTVAASSRFRTPATAQSKRPATAQKAGASAVTPKASSFRPTPAAHCESTDPSTPDQAISSPSVAATPVETPSERFPRFAPRNDYEEHAQTAAAPVYLRTPTQSPLKRPSTTQKPTSLRKVAFKNSTPMSSRTPVKTPLKPPAMTPSQAPMTPHPAAPLKGVVAMVEVFTLEGASASAPFLALLHRLGAKATKAWSDRVTHVIFKDGSPTTLQRVRLHNKEVDETSKGTYIYCVNSRWVGDCETDGARVDETEELYAVDVAEIPRGGKRRRKSMEPSALVNLGGNIVRDSKNSLGHSSIGRSPLKFADSPAKEFAVTPEIVNEDKENSGDPPSPDSPATPAYLAAPDLLIQQTAPINRMRKLGGKAQDRAKNRRLTYFPTRA